MRSPESRPTSRAGIWGAAAGPRPRRDRSVDSRTVACPTCEAGVGEPCASAHTHRARRRLAVRRLWDAGELGPAEVVIPSARQIRTARLRAGLTQAELGEICGVHGTLVWRWEHDERRPAGAPADQLARWFAEAKGAQS